MFKREQRRPLLRGAGGFRQATLGGEVEVPTLDGRASIKVPPGTQSEKVFRLRGKGVRNVRSNERVISIAA